MTDAPEKPLSALERRAYMLSEPHLSGWKLTLGFETLADLQAAQDEILTLPQIAALIEMYEDDFIACKECGHQHVTALKDIDLLILIKSVLFKEGSGR